MQVEIWSDIVCPWCAIGKARFESALAAFAHRDTVQVRYRSFELDPTAPAVRDVPTVEHLAGKYGVSLAEAQSMTDRVVAAAREEGLDFRFDRARSGNTFDAHRLLHLSWDAGIQVRVKDALLRAYFTDGRAIGDAAELRDIGVAAGLDAGAVDEVLAGDAYADAVRADEQQAATFGISGVPFFVLGRRFGVSGAQPAATLLAALEQAHAESTGPATEAGDRDATGDRDARDGHTHDDHDHAVACTDDSCAV